MIHNVPRDQIRMKSGQVLTVDPIAAITYDSSPRDLRAFNTRIRGVLRDSKKEFLVVRVYDRMDSIVAATNTVVFIEHIETISSLIVQINAHENMTFPAY